jgi:hypothetical protein
MALHQAGARPVSLLVVARWIKEEFGDNASFPPQAFRQRLQPRRLSLDWRRLPFLPGDSAAACRVTS